MLIPNLQVGGAEIVVARLLNGLDRERYRPELILLDGGAIEVPLADDVRVRRISGRTFMLALPGLARTLRRDPPDLLVAHMSLPGVYAVLARIASRRPLKVVIVEHNEPSVEYPSQSSRRRRLMPLLMRSTYRFADGLVSISTRATHDLEELLGKPRGTVTTIRNPCIPADFEIRAAQAPGHPWLVDPAIRVILSVGRLAPQKNYELLIRSFGSVADRYPDVRLLIVGEGPLRDSLEQLVSTLGLDGRISLPGATDNPYPAMRHAAAFAMSSLYEGAPLVAVEAVACGCRVIATDAGFLTEFLDASYGDVIVSTATVKAYSAGLARMLDASSATHRETAARVAPYEEGNAVAAYERMIDGVVRGDIRGRLDH